MAKFTDAKGREWEFRRITVGDLDELAALGLDVEAVSEDFGQLAALGAKPRAFATVLWWFVGNAVTAAKVEPVDFKAGLDGDAMARAFDALRDAVIGFFPYPPTVKATLIARLAAEQEKAWATAVGSAVEPTNSPPSPASTPDP